MLTLTVAAILFFSVIYSPPTAHAQFDIPFFETALRDVTNAAASVYVPAEGIIADVSRFFEQTANHITNTAASFRDFIARMFGTTPPPPAPTPIENVEERERPREVRPPLPPSPPPAPPLAPPLLPPPAQAPEEGATPGAAAERRPNRETFIVNTNLRVAGNAEIRGDIHVTGEMSIAEQLRAMNLFVSGGTDTGTLTVREGAETRGLLRALGGIRTGGADIDLEGGRILGFEYVRSITAGDNIIVTGEDGNLTISATNNNVGVLSLNGLTGTVSLVGLPNQIEVTPTGRTLRLSLPQDIGTISSPTFAGLTVTGNMGVGLTSPTSRLHLRGGDLRVDDAVNSPALFVQQSTGNVGIGLPIPTSRLHVRGGDLRVDDSLNNPALFVQQSTGNVGLGTTAPTVRLDIDGQIRIRGGAPAAGRLLTAGADGTATWEPPPGGGFLPTGTVNQTLRHDGTGWIATSNLLNDGTNVGIGLPSPTSRLHVRGGDLRVDDSLNNPALFVQQSTGNVGLGITPTERLHVAGNILGTGWLRVADGTAAAPAFSFSADPDTGIFRQALDVLGFTTAGVERARLSATGLDIRTGGLLVNGTERITSAGALTNITTLNTHAIPTGTGTLAVSATLPITLSTAGAIGIQRADLLGTANRVTVTGGTGVLLGTTNATLTLPQDIHTGASPTFAGLSLGTGAITGGTATLSSTGNALTLSGAGANINFSGTGLAQIITAAGQNLALMPGGNVGIGTTAPNARLEVTDEIRVRLASDFPTLNVARIIPLGGSGVTGAQNWALRGVYQYAGGVALNAPGGDLDLIKSLDGNTILATRRDGAPLGNVGIGTTAPDARLEIQAISDPRIRLRQTGSVNHWETGVGGGIDFVVRDSANALDVLTFFAGGGFTVRNAGAVTMHNPGGSSNVGIGTTTPTERLHVAGNILGTGWLRLADGTAATPAFSFSADPDTGIFSLAADVLGFTTAGVERVRIAATGLDIRTGGLLVSGTERLTSAGALTNIATLNTHTIPTGTGTLAISATAPVTLSAAGAIGVQRADLVGTANRVTVTGGTGVLLGTTNATLTLPQDIHTGASPTFAGLSLGAGAITGGTATLSSTGNALTLSGAGANINFSGTGLAQIITAAGQNLALMPGGNVGIGTTAPGRRLDVLDAAHPQLRITQAGAVFGEFLIDAAGDLRVSTTGRDIRMLDENLWVCEAGACPTPTGLSPAGNVIIEGDIVAAGVRRISCPAGMIEVPPSPQHGTQGFCVDKFEAKNDGTGRAVSQMAGTPWVNITQFNARAECQRAGKRLLTERERLAIANNIERTAWNWSGGAVASGQMSDGHSDNVPANALAADVDTNPCFGTGDVCSETVWHSQRRTYRLSNGETIWDFGGNVWEWVDQVNEDEYPVQNSLAAAWRACSTAGDGICGNTLTTNDQWHSGGTVLTRGFLRGGSWGGGAHAGAFVLHLNAAPSHAGADVGFRCAR